MIDFTDLPVRKKTYAGANGSKIAVIYNGAQYILKFPTPPSRNKEMSYTNGCASEYIWFTHFCSAGHPRTGNAAGNLSKERQRESRCRL